MTYDFTGRTALVTGSTKGVGRAVACSLADAGAQVLVTGTDQCALDEISRLNHRGRFLLVPSDLTVDADIDRLVQIVGERMGRLDILVHSAGRFLSGTVSEAPVNSIDELHALNVRAPYLLTRALLPELIATRGDLVFINSSLGEHGRSGVSQYSASKHALRAIADSVREEVNGLGVRVISLYLGRTATPMQEAVHRNEKRHYDPGRLLQPQSVAEILLAALALPDTAEVTDLHVRPRYKPN